MNINSYGLVRVAAASPKVRVADCDYNISEIKKSVSNAAEENVQIVLFPELSITSYSCGDLFNQRTLQTKALAALEDFTQYMGHFHSTIAIVGLPLLLSNRLYNVAAVVSYEGVLGFVPKTTIPVKGDVAEARWFSEPKYISEQFVNLNGEQVLIHKGGMIFKTPFVSFAIEIGEDLWSSAPPSTNLAALGADIILNPFAAGERVGSDVYLKSIALAQSARCNVGYVAAGASSGESSTDNVFAGSTFIAENGKMLVEGRRFSLEGQLTIADMDIEMLRSEKLRSDLLTNKEMTAVVVECDTESVSVKALHRVINPHPFIPSDDEKKDVLADVFSIQVHGLIKRLKHTGIEKVTIGVSGGLDSTLALLVVAHAFDALSLPRENIVGITMPGFGTTSRTYNNAVDLMKSLGISIKEISIMKSVTQHLEDIEHDIFQHDVTYENAQARERTQILMNYANKIGGLVVGTGNMSELALGWATYNGDHMSMYGVNAGIPKTLVSTLTRWIATQSTDIKTREVLLDIVDTPFSPELLPADKEGNIAQETEHFVGPYELHDFFMHRILRYGDVPARIVFLAEHAFKAVYSAEDIVKWLKVFYRRFFAQQFKRSCMPDGPRVGSVNLSPRGAWHMPSDAVVKAWMDELS